MRTRGAIITIVPALLAVVCLQSGSTEAQENMEARLRAAVNASNAAHVAAQPREHRGTNGSDPCLLDPRMFGKRSDDNSTGE